MLNFAAYPTFEVLPVFRDTYGAVLAFACTAVTLLHVGCDERLECCVNCYFTDLLLYNVYIR